MVNQSIIEYMVQSKKTTMNNQHIIEVDRVVLEQQKALGILLGQMPIILEAQNNIFTRLDGMNMAIGDTKVLVEHVKDTLNHGRMENIDISLKSMQDKLTRVEKDINNLYFSIKKFHGEDEVSKKGILGFIDKAWKDFLDKVGWILVLASVWLIIEICINNSFLILIKKLF